MSVSAADSSVAGLIRLLAQQDPLAQVRFCSTTADRMPLLSVYSYSGMVWIDLGPDEASVVKSVPSES